MLAISIAHRNGIDSGMLQSSTFFYGAAMEVKRQTCQACQSIDVRNIIVREGRDQVIFVRCAHCKELVARYELKDYYHHGKGIESYLRAHGAGGGDSGRAWLEAFNKSQEQAINGFQQALAELDATHKDA